MTERLCFHMSRLRDRDRDFAAMQDFPNQSVNYGKIVYHMSRLRDRDFAAILPRHLKYKFCPTVFSYQLPRCLSVLIHPGAHQCFVVVAV